MVDIIFLLCLSSVHLGFVLGVLPRSGRRKIDLGRRIERLTIIDIASWDDCIWNISIDLPFVVLRAG